MATRIPRTLGAARVLAAVLAERSRYAESNRIFEETLAVQERALGEDHVETIATMYDWIFALFWQYRPASSCELTDRALAIALNSLGPEHYLTIRLEWVKGIYEWGLGFPDLAEERQRRLLSIAERALGEHHPATLAVKMHLGHLVHGPNALQEAERIYSEALDAFRAAKLEDQREALFTKGLYLPGNLIAQGRAAEAVALAEQAVRDWVSTRGGFSHPAMALRMSYLRALAAAGRQDEHHELTRQLVAELAARLDAPDPEAWAVYWYALLLWSPYDDIRDPERALVVAQRSAELYGYQSPWPVALLAHAYRANDRLDEAAQAYRQALDALPPGPSDDRTSCQLSLAYTLITAGDHDAAAEITESLVESTREAHGDEQAELVRRMIDLSLIGKSVGTTAILDREVFQATRGLHPDDTGVMPLDAFIASRRAQAVSPPWHLVKQGRCADAERLLRAYLRVQEVTLPPGNWRHAETLSWLGSALTGQERLEEAEELLLDAYERMKDAPEAPPESIAHAVERIVALHEASDRPAEADEWRATLTGLNARAGEDNSE